MYLQNHRLQNTSYMSEKSRFRIALDSQYVKGSETLLESAGQHFYHIISSL